MVAARMPAFFEAFSATVATGMPFGICNMDKIESHPSRELDDLIGTPITGRDVREATIPGKCAAPPAPAIFILNPLSHIIFWGLGEIVRKFFFMGFAL